MYYLFNAPFWYHSNINRVQNNRLFSTIDQEGSFCPMGKKISINNFYILKKVRVINDSIVTRFLVGVSHEVVILVIWGQFWPPRSPKGHLKLIFDIFSVLPRILVSFQNQISSLEIYFKKSSNFFFRNYSMVSNVLCKAIGCRITAFFPPAVRSAGFGWQGGKKDN